MGSSAVDSLAALPKTAGQLGVALESLQTDVDAAYIHCDLDVLDPG
jgi:arginase family enzyme